MSSSEEQVSSDSEHEEQERVDEQQHRPVPTSDDDDDDDDGEQVQKSDHDDEVDQTTSASSKKRSRIRSSSSSSSSSSAASSAVASSPAESVGDQGENRKSTASNDDEEEDGNRGGSGSDREKVAGSDDDDHESPPTTIRRDQGSDDDEDEDVPQRKPKKQRLVESRSNSEAGEDDVVESATKSPTHADLFGDADDVLTSSDDEGEKVRSPTAGGETPVHGDEDDEEVQRPMAPPPETILNAEIPKITVDLGQSIHFVKFPNFLSVEPRPFDPETYEDEVDESDEILDEEGRSRLKLKVENTIRWRLGLDDEGNIKRESNAKVVRWSDGSMSLYLGSEVFDVHTHPLQGDHHHLFVRQGTGLQGRNVFRTKLTFRPHSTDSFTHRKMTLSMADKTNKAQNKVKVLPAVGKNPESIKQELIKKEEERIRASARRESQQRRMRERTHGGGGGRGALSAAFLEPDRGHESDEGGVSLTALKNRYKTGAKDFAAARGGARRPYSDEEEEEIEEASDDERKKASTSKQGKRIVDSDEDEDDSKSAAAGASARVASTDRPSTDRPSESKRRANVIEESDDD